MKERSGAGSMSRNAVNGNVPELICNRAPSAVATPDSAVYECNGPTSNVSLDGRLSSDPDLRDELTYSWLPTTGLADPSAALTHGNFGLGSESYTLPVTDLLGKSDSDGASFTLLDTWPAPMILLWLRTTCVSARGDPTLAQALGVCDTNPSVTRTPAGSSWSLGETDVTHSG